MTSRLLLPAALRRYAGDRAEVEIHGGTLGAALDDLAELLPQLERRLRDEQGQLRPHVLMFVDGVSVRSGAPMETRVADGAEIFVAPAVSGGDD
ncbi:MAG TPA: MoaD/ThiS family protein [Candidatus Saccharimonadales bacterium]|nr:MoaD/ThiS family protein [Candidatus Saccharimonadales bacterium]